MDTTVLSEEDSKKRRVLILTAALAKACGQEVPTHGELTLKGILLEQGLHGGLLDPRISMAALEKAQPSLTPLFDEVNNPSEEEEITPHSVKMAAVMGHTLLRLLSDAPHGGQGGTPNGESYGTWKDEVDRLSKGKKGKGGKGEGKGQKGSSSEKERGEDGHAVGEGVSDEALQLALDEAAQGRGFANNPHLQTILPKREANILRRMPLSEILADPDALAKITPSLSMISMLMQMKGALEGPALQGAKYLIKRYCEEAMRVVSTNYNTQTGFKSSRKKKTAEPRRSMANVHIPKTVMRNLHNYDPKTGKVIVDPMRLVYKPDKGLKDQGRIIICVDQSGSMAESLIHASIIAAIFASKGRDVRLYIYDTEYVDLSPYAKDPLSVLLKANLGGGTDGLGCAVQATKDLKNPEKDLIVWISDFEDNQALLPVFKGWIDMGVTFLPVGPISDSGYRGVNQHFETTLKGWQCSILQGSLKTLIGELKAALGQAQ